MKKSLLICILAVMLCVSMLFAACAPSLEAATLESMKEILYQMYKGSNPTNTYKVTGMVASNGERANVQWSVNVTAGDENAVKVGEYDEESKQVTIEVDPEPATDVAYTLTATLVNEKGVAYKIDGEPVSVSFERSLTAFVINTYEEYLAACEADDGTIIRVRGYVTGVNADSGSSSKGSLWIRDAEGHGYYAYKPALDSSITASRESINAAFPVGAEVIISGPVNSTYGPQHKEGCEITKTGNTAPAGWNTPVDQTEAFGSADDMLDAESLQQYYGSIVTIKGVTLGQHETGTYNYYFTVNGVEYIFYMNIYLMDTEASNATAAKWVVGGKANLTGLVTTYNKKFQLYPYSPDCLEIIQEDLTDAQKVERAQANLTIADTAAEGDEITLPATGAEGTTITWALAEGKTYDFATLADGKLTITATPSSTTKIQLVATITCGSESATKALEVTVAGATFELINFAQAEEIALAQAHNTYTADKYYIMGTIKEVYNTTYGNMYIVDEHGNQFTIYGTYSADGSTRYDAMENAPVAGDVVIICGALGQYNGAAQIKNGWIVASYDVKTLEEAKTLGEAQEHNTYTADKYYLVAIVKEVYNTTYGNMYVKDAQGNEFTVYGTYDATGANRYDAMQKAPVAGDIVVVYGVLGQYNGTAQMKNGWIVVVGPAGVAPAPAHTCESVCPTCNKCTNTACTETACATKCEGHEGGGETPAPHTCESVCPTCNKCTNTACTETACADKCEGHQPAEKITTIAGALAAANGAEVELTGTVTEIYQAWNPQYNNVSFYISDGTSRILVFRTGTNAGIGDVVKVVGTVTPYNEINQVAQGSTTTIVTAHECTDFTPADCLNAAVCTVCGETSGEALGHTEANGEGKCDRCGADVGSATQQITASKTMAELITALGWTNATTKQSFNLDDKVSVKINGGSNTGKAYDGNHIRIYATDSPAGTITISVPAGYELVSVKISAQTGTYAELHLAGGSTDICNVVTAVSGQSVVLNSVKVGSDGKQVRVTAIEVVYVAVAQ